MKKSLETATKFCVLHKCWRETKIEKEQSTQQDEGWWWNGENWSECVEGYFIGIEMDISEMELIGNICKLNFLVET